MKVAVDSGTQCRPSSELSELLSTRVSATTRADIVSVVIRY